MCHRCFAKWLSSFIVVRAACRPLSAAVRQVLSMQALGLRPSPSPECRMWPWRMSHFAPWDTACAHPATLAEDGITWCSCHFKQVIGGGEADRERSSKVSFHPETQVPAGYPQQANASQWDPQNPQSFWQDDGERLFKVEGKNLARFVVFPVLL